MQRSAPSRWARGRDLQAELEQKIAGAEWRARQPRLPVVPALRIHDRPYPARPPATASVSLSALAQRQRA
eukprot:4323763-Pleurochrysis_carterae.AAC.3